MIRVKVFGTNYREIIIFLALLYQPKKNTSLSAYGGQRHLHYLKEYRRGTYINLLTSGRLNAYLVKIDKQAQKRFERLIEGMKRTQGITEQLKAENGFEWIRRINNILACAWEIVNEEIIFA